MEKEHYKNDLAEFANDLYDLMGKNTQFMTQDEFFEKYVENDNAFMVFDNGKKQVIYFDDFTITVTANKN